MLDRRHIVHVFGTADHGTIDAGSGRELSLFDVTEASQIITEAVDPNANIIFGAVIDEALEDEIRVTVIATGFEKKNPTLKNATTIKSPEAEHKPTSSVINGFNGGNEIPPWLRR